MDHLTEKPLKILSMGVFNKLSKNLKTDGISMSEFVKR